MRGVLWLSWRHVARNRAQTVVLVLCLAVPVFLPAGTALLVGRYQEELVSRAAGTPLVAGPKGNRYDLTLAALYFRQGELETIPFSQAEVIRESGLGLAVPMNVRFAARGHPIVGTSPEYHELRGLRAARGTLPLRLGDAALGARVAEALRLAPGDRLFSDQRELYDISKPPALKMTVAGVLEETGTPDDDAVFVDVRTVWILEGLVHGHAPAERMEDGLVLGRTEERVVVSPAMIEYNEVTPANERSFHYHGETDALPLSAIIVLPHDHKGRTLLKARFNASERWQMLVPTRVIEDLLGFVFRIKQFFDSYSVVLAATTVLMATLVIALSMRLRAREMDTLNRIGCSRSTVARLHASEIGIVALLSVALAGVGVLALGLLLPDLSRIIT